MQRGDVSTTVGHSASCRERVEEEMLKYEDFAQELIRCQERMEKAQERNLEELAEKKRKWAEEEKSRKLAEEEATSKPKEEE
eukprot:8342656-Lingulodinium_polyedra.AAC.1